MRQLLEGRDGDDDSALVAGLSSDLIEDRVYVLTPRGEVIDLPRGGTVLDFASHVHTEVGHRCRGAKVNGRIVPLNHATVTGDRSDEHTFVLQSLMRVSDAVFCLKKKSRSGIHSG